MIKIFKILPTKVKIYFLIGVLVIVLNVASSLFLPFFLSQFIKLIAQGSSVKTSNILVFGRWEIYSGNINDVLTTLAYLTVSLIFINLLTSTISIVLTTWSGELTSYNLRKKLFSKIQKLSLTDVSQFKQESIITRISNDVANYWDFLIGATSSLIRAPLLIIVGSVFMIITDAYMSLSLLLIIPTLVLVLYFVFKKTKPLLKENQTILDEITKNVDENILGIRLIKIYNMKENRMDKFHKKNNEWLVKQKRINTIFSITHPVFFVLINIVLVFVYSLAAYFVNAGNVTFEYLSIILIFTDYVFLISYAIIILSEFLVLFFRAKVSCVRINEILDYEHQELYRTIGNNLVPKDNRGLAVEFKNLNFKYYEKSKKYALKDINFKIEPGETLGIIGPTGSGKSTIANLLVNNLKYGDGSIKINDLEVNSISSQTLHKEVGIVYQDALLYTGTIKSNLLFSKTDATEEEISTALNSACAASYINRFDDKLDHVIVQGAKNLSGGQKQRLSIARTLLRRPKLLILDDSTSALDNITTNKLLSNIKDHYNCTTVIISQKINSIKNANKILVMDKSEIVDIGTHQELVEKNKWYNHVFENQLEH